MKYILPLLVLATPVFAQGTDLPIQDERLDVPACLIAVNGLPASYRGQLYDACTNIPANLCLVRGTPETCLHETAARIVSFYQEHRAELPEEIKGSTLAQRSYKTAVRRIGENLDNDVTCQTTDTELKALCVFETRSEAIKSFFRQTRRAGVTLK
ncbi:MAG: hypothetical protein ACPG5U_00550 [Planktomarina sp.]